MRLALHECVLAPYRAAFYLTLLLLFIGLPAHYTLVVVCSWDHTTARFFFHGIA